MQGAGQRAAGERSGIHPIDRRVAVHHRVELLLGFATRRASGGLAAGEPVCGHRVGAEPRGDIAARQRRELSDVSDSHAPQQVRQILSPWRSQARLGGQLPDRQRRQEQCVVAGLDDSSRPRGEHRGGQLIGDADLAFGSGRGHRVDQPLGRGLFGSEVTGRPAHRQHQQAGPQDLGARHQVVHRGRHILEMASIARRIGGDDVQIRTPGL